jgi:hypothetical protein
MRTLLNCRPQVGDGGEDSAMGAADQIDVLSPLASGIEMGLSRPKKRKNLRALLPEEEGQKVG